MSESGGFIGTVLGAGAGGVLIGAVGTIIVALINRQAPMAALVDQRIRALLEAYEKQNESLREEIARLEKKVAALEAARSASAGP